MHKFLTQNVHGENDLVLFLVFGSILIRDQE